ncbi:MAG: hypothetical protein ABH827_05595 [bacterium]
MNIKKILFTLSTVTLCLGFIKIHAQLPKLEIPETAIANQITQALQNNSHQKRIDLLQALISQEERKQSVLSPQTQQALLNAIIEIFNQRTQNPELRTNITLNLLQKAASSRLFTSSPELISIIKNQLIPNTRTNKEILLVANTTIDPTIQATIKSHADFGVTGIEMQQTQQVAHPAQAGQAQGTRQQQSMRPKRAQVTQQAQQQAPTQTKKAQASQENDINPLIQTEIENINKLGLISGTIQALLNLIKEVNNMPGNINAKTQDVFSKAIFEAFNQGLANEDLKQNLGALLQAALQSRLLAPNQQNYVRTNMLPKLSSGTQAARR